ncbi:MAG: GDP-mannose 4,6-dehydratase [Gemmataceae bacterium]|nr:GDP-mannose 4,6-dehydratase [Gemmataceae bacterium]MCI0740920.1 GDP-mannose 4,6-dehydratase [Gemmataceae bacterium]
MHCLVTGAAGFIGSHLCERLIADGHRVSGLDAFIPYYPREIKETYLKDLRRQSQFIFRELDMRSADLDSVVEGADVVFHLGAMAGLAKSWTDFDLYQSCNLTATQRLLEAVRKRAKPSRFIFGSTSSVYGRFATGDETLPTRPISPYGVTKLAAENLCRCFADEHGIPVVALRFFSVYGPRQRPDMGYYKFIRALLRDETITVFGDGQQVRGNTYIDDCVSATVAAMQAPVGETYNLGGGETASVWGILHKLETLMDRKAKTKLEPARPGDQRSTFADTAKLRRHLSWEPKTTLDQGLMKQIEWQKGLP